jgi:hypothetical protein
MRRPLLTSLALCLLASACAPNALAPKGGSCHSLSDCQVGLVCLDARCSDDTSALEGRTPNFEMDAALAVDADGATAPGDAGASGDAASVLVDASSPADAGSAAADAGHDAGTRDAGPRDAAVVDAGSGPDAELDAGAEVDAGEAGAG